MFVIYRTFYGKKSSGSFTEFIHIESSLYSRPNYRYFITLFCNILMCVIHRIIFFLLHISNWVWKSRSHHETFLNDRERGSKNCFSLFDYSIDTVWFQINLRNNLALIFRICNMFARRRRKIRKLAIQK